MRHLYFIGFLLVVLSGTTVYGQDFEDFSLSLKSRHIQGMFSKDRDTIFFLNDSGIFKLYYKEDKVAVVVHLAIGEGAKIGYLPPTKRRGSPTYLFWDRIVTRLFGLLSANQKR